MSYKATNLKTMKNSHNTTNFNAKAASELRLYDSKSHSVTPFVPIKVGEVGIYVCGATVQSSPHVGHLRAGVAFDVIRRWMMRLGYHVTFVRNVTDIDDKILDKAAAAGQQWWECAYIYEREFTAAYALLGVLPPTYEPRATGHVPDMINLIQRLIDNGHAYVVNNPDGTPSGNVYFDVPSWQAYGELTHQASGTQAASTNLVDSAVEAAAPSVDNVGSDKYNPVDAADLSENKHNPRDFALWKAPKDTDPFTARWNTPFGVGRPGWHIECSAMSQRYLGDDFDIHGGGLDLRFPHHENEMAQSRAAGWGFAHRWMHSAWVTQKGEKMSKSLGNGLSIESVLEGYTPWMVRYALAGVHYRSMLEWGPQTLTEAQRAWERISSFIDHAGALIQQPSRAQVEEVSADFLPEDFTNAMNDDVNIPGALAAIFSTVRAGNTMISDLAAMPDGDARETACELLSRTLLNVRAMLDTLGLDPLDSQWITGAGSPTRTSEAHDQNSATAAGGTSANSYQAENTLNALIQNQLDARSTARKNKVSSSRNCD